MKLRAVWALAKIAYRTILRPLVIEKIDNPNSEIDDVIIKILDSIFDYSE